MSVAVHITGHGRTPGVETTFTENVSSRGARVTSMRRWSADELRSSGLRGHRRDGHIQDLLVGVPDACRPAAKRL